MTSRGQAGLLLLLVLLAGCAGTKAAPNDVAIPDSVVGGTGEGVIGGLVTDVEIVPLVGARIQIVDESRDWLPALNLRTDEGGRFLATGLEAGDHVVYVSKLGYGEPQPKVVTVGQEPVDLSFLLDRLAAPVPFYETVRYPTSYPLMLCLVVPGDAFCERPYGQFPNQYYTHVVDESANGRLASLVVEMSWAQEVPFCPAGMRNDVYSPDDIDFSDTSDENPYHWDSLPKVTNPTHLIIFRAGTDDAMLSPTRTDLNDGLPLTTSGDWTIVTNPEPVAANGAPAGIDCGYNQGFTNWVTSFYLEPAPEENWSIVPDA